MARAATAADVVAFYGAPQRETLRAMVVEVDGEVAGIVGLARSASAVRLFSEYKPALEPFLSSVTVWRAIKRVLAWAAQMPCPVYAVSNDARLMGRIGFHEVREGVWRN